MACRKSPCGGSSLLDGNSIGPAIFDGRTPAENSACRIHCVMERDINWPRNILEHNFESVRSLRMAFVMQNQVAIAVSECYFQRWFAEQARAPARIFLRCVCVRGIKRRPLAQWLRLRKTVARGQPPAPVELLQLSARIDPKYIRDSSAIQTKDFRRCVEAGACILCEDK